jgi:MFS family permease
MAMVMIDFTIVSISVTTIQRDLHLSATAAQWMVTAYALATAAFIALGGRLGDIIGHKRIVAIGIVLFAGASTACGLTPDTGIAEPWLIVCRVLQGIGGALLIPSTTVLVLNSFPPQERGKGLAIFFIVAGLFTAVGPIAGSYLTEFWTWRAIFWINVPVALLSLTEFALIKLKDVKHPARIDWGGAVLLVAGMGLLVLGLQQSDAWGWESVATIASIVLGLVILALFVMFERRTESPLISIKASVGNRAFAVDNVLTMFLFFTWLAVFFFGSIYFQVSVGQEPTQAGFSDPDDVLFVLHRVPDRGWDVRQIRGEASRDAWACRDRRRPLALGVGAVGPEPQRRPRRHARDRGRIRPHDVGAQHRCPQPCPGGDQGRGVGDHPDVPELRLGAGDGDPRDDRARRAGPPHQSGELRRRARDRLLRGRRRDGGRVRDRAGVHVGRETDGRRVIVAGR